VEGLREAEEILKARGRRARGKTLPIANGSICSAVVMALTQLW